MKDFGERARLKHLPRLFFPFHIVV